MKNILVSIDFDGNEQVLLDNAVMLAQKFGSKIWVLHIAAPNPDFVGYEVGPRFERDFRANQLREEHKKIQEYSDNLEQKGLHAEALLIQGATVETIMEKANDLNIDLIIAGHSDHDFLYKAFIGSVSSQIIKKSKIPVLIVPLD
ncbi:universal stress protein [Flavobacteriaceae bacterium SZ-1-7]|uniref:universal stress protein n=1 Tax=Tamlana sedimenti TaxID=3134126 RepID=UPI003120B139